MSQSEEREELEKKAKERVDEMPAETALGNADPAGGESDVSPEDYQNVQNDPKE